MPLYEYVCPKCGCKFELLRPISRSNEGAPCPSCQHEAERVLSAFAPFSKDSSGLTTSVGGNPCSGCSATSCESCNL